MRTIKHIDDALRYQIIGEYLDGASKYSLVKKYKLAYAKTITNWMRIFGIEDSCKSPIPAGSMDKQKKKRILKKKYFQVRNPGNYLKTLHPAK